MSEQLQSGLSHEEQYLSSSLPERLLVELTRIWGRELEPSDIFARLGGDEFLVLLVGSSDEERARLLERLRFASPTPWSAGVIPRQPGEDLSTCLARADIALYDAKRSRRPRREPDFTSQVAFTAHGRVPVSRSLLRWQRSRSASTRPS